MSRRRLRGLGLDGSLLQHLHRNNLKTCQDVLSKTEVELLHMLNVSIFVIDDLLERVCQVCAPVSTTAFDIWEARKRKAVRSFVPTSLKELDVVLKGGLPSGTVTEIAGPAGCGKTQFCLMMCLMSVINDGLGDCGMASGVIYIDTESAFSPHRLVEMAQCRFPQIFSTAESQRNLLSRICVCTELQCSSLLSRLENLEEVVIVNGAKLVILDSVASLIRKEFDAGVRHNLAERSKTLAKIAALLKQTAENLSIPIVVTNQITTHLGPHSRSTEFTGEMSSNMDHDDGAYVTVALGNTWSHCINTRLIVQYIDDVTRQLLVAKSPIAPFTSFVYRIDASGLVLDESGFDHYEGTDPGLQKIRVRSVIQNDAFHVD